MSDEADGAAVPTPDPTSTPDRMLALQQANTEIDQLTHRRAHLPERTLLGTVTTQMAEWEAQRLRIRTRLDELQAAIERAESDAAGYAAQRTRLEAQMKTVIAPREAEALMHEIDTVTAHLDAVEIAEIEALEEQSSADDSLTAHLRDEASLRAATESADDALGRAVEEIDGEVATWTARRDERRGELSESLLARYDRVRSASGVAVARLVGHRCDGCHLDLSAAEIDDLKDEAAAGDGLSNCPQCGRILIV